MVVEFSLKFKNLVSGRKFSVPFTGPEDFDFQSLIEKSNENGLIEIVNKVNRKVVWKNEIEG